MEKILKYTPVGICPKSFEICYENDVIKNIKSVGGCSGNLQGISSLLKGMKIKEAIKKLEDIRCGYKFTSCPDQIAKALKTIIDNK